MPKSYSFSFMLQSTAISRLTTIAQAKHSNTHYKLTCSTQCLAHVRHTDRPTDRPTNRYRPVYSSVHFSSRIEIRRKLNKDFYTRTIILLTAHVSPYHHSSSKRLAYAPFSLPPPPPPFNSFFSSNRQIIVRTVTPVCRCTRRIENGTTIDNFVVSAQPTCLRTRTVGRMEIIDEITLCINDGIQDRQRVITGMGESISTAAASCTKSPIRRLWRLSIDDDSATVIVEQQVVLPPPHDCTVRRRSITRANNTKRFEPAMGKKKIQNNDTGCKCMP